jgi:SHS2 domain-containing protein
MPFEEVPHTADLCLRVWANDLQALFVEAARGMNILAGVQLASGPAHRRVFVNTALDLESQLVTFLSELVFIAEHEAMGFDQFTLRFEGRSLHADMAGAPIEAIKKTIKAVTYHNIQIQQTARGWEVEIVFDV